jgi:hypothetical protein
MNTIRWRRVLAGGLFIELTMLAIVLPLNAVSPQAVYYLVPVLALLTAVLYGYWAAKPVDDGFVLHGALVAIVASMLYVILTTAAGAPVPLLYHLSHGLRLLGGVVGGRLARRRTRSLSPARSLTH